MSDDLALLSELLSSAECRHGRSTSARSAKARSCSRRCSRQLEAEARQRPVLMVFEDAHWIDPTSRELLDLTVDRVRHLPVLLAITFRPEFQPPWARPRRMSRAGAQSARRARRRGDGANSGRQCRGSPPTSSRRSSSAPTGCRCLSRN